MEGWGLEARQRFDTEKDVVHSLLIGGPRQQGRRMTSKQGWNWAYRWRERKEEGGRIAFQEQRFGEEEW